MKYTCTLLLAFLMVNLSIGQSFFKSIDESKVLKQITTDRSIVPSKYAVALLDVASIKNYLTTEVIKEDQGKMLFLIDPKGEEVGFRIFETRMMEDGIAAKYPGIKTYKGYNPDKKYEQVHFGISSTGFYATVNKPGESYSIDRYADKEDRFYISYYLKDHIDEGAMSHTCGTTGSQLKEEELNVRTRSAGALLPLREYRFAVACTGEFGSFYGPDKADVLGEMMKSVNRMNLALENDFAIRLVIIDNNDAVIFTDADTDPYPDGNTGGTLLGENTAVLSSRVGFGNFDLGHVYTRGCDDTGGIANIRSACSANKGAGVTCHYSNDITAMAIRVAAHEVGHQLGSNHTFNNCSGNENGGTAFEPGSGSTIMSYGGLCGSDLNVVSVSDDYYHISSIIEIIEYTREGLGNNCPEQISTENNIPDIEIPIEGGFSIPISTPFELEGVATDEDNDDLTYTWEQFNLGPSVAPGSPTGNSPLFVSAYPSPDPKRVFPKMSSIVNNTSEKQEVLPTYERDLTFQFVVRDNNPESGAVAWEEIEFYSTETAGPFLVEFPNLRDTFKVGEEIDIKWDVANTDNEIVNCKSVDILISTDGGYTYDVTLLKDTPNDGSEKIFVPNMVGNKARLKIKAAANIFFDISNENFTIEEPIEPGFLFTYTPSYSRTCVPDDIVIEISTEGFLGYTESINFDFIGDLPSGTSVNFSEGSVAPGEKTTATVTFEDLTLTGLNSFTLRAYNDSDTLIREILLDLVSTDFSEVAGLSPIEGSSGNIVAPILFWKGDNDAVEYEINLSDNPSFDEEKSEILYKEIVTDTFFVLADILSKNTVYYWQVVAMNECGDGSDSEIYAFATEAISCNIYTYNDVPLGISQSGVIEITMPIEIIGGGEVSDVNVKRIKGTHGWVSELKGELVSPSGTNVLLFSNKCGNQSNFNAGFDDDAVGPITCPLNQGIFYQPQEKLDTFIGEEIAGEWIFKLTDTKIGNGGTVQEYVLEVCSNEVLDGPVLVINEQMPLPSGVGRRLSSDFLLTEDANNDIDELLYTLVKLPLSGSLRNEDEVLVVGSQFTQNELNSMKIRYQHDGTSSEDSFLFTVEDGEGGWISTTAFQIEIDENAILDVEDLLAPDFQIFPNPVKDRFTITFSGYSGELSLEIVDLMGRRVGSISKNISSGKEVSVRDLSSGVYFISLYGNGFTAVRKIVVE